MCGVASPPLLLPAGPTQAPWAWAFYGLVVVLGCGRYLLWYRRLPVGGARTFVLWMYLGGCVAILLFAFLSEGLAIPWGIAVERWYDAQLGRMPPACLLTPLDATRRVAQDAGNVISALGIGAFLLGIVLVGLADLRYRRVLARAR